MYVGDIRAVRNNNPGNIRIGQHWQGLMPIGSMTPAQLDEKDFCVFVDAKAGFRAMAEIFHTYNRVDRIQTLREAINRWAPPSENNTDAYVKSVCDYTAFNPDALFPFCGPIDIQASLLKAVSIHEVGVWYFLQADLLAGIAAAA